MLKYKIFNHTADIGCEISGKNRKELFANSVTALFALILEQNSAAAIRKSWTEEKVTIAGKDLEDLFVNFLREILYLFNGNHLVITGCRPLEITTKKIVVQLSAEQYNPRKHIVKTEIKAVTYHDLSIKKTKTGWKARVIFDV